jgi:hypothetical protein
VAVALRVTGDPDGGDVPSLHAGLDTYFNIYNYERPHQSLGYATPADVHFAGNVPSL